MSLTHQDWTPVVIRNAKVAAARAPKESVGRDKGHDQRSALRKLESDTAVSATEEAPPAAKLPRLDATMRQTMIQARIAQKLSQSDLAKRLNMRPQIINELESGKAIAENEKSILQKLQKVLGVALHFEK
jgi:ribosome-binding protein aMBF1 (putative translation factor)